MRSARAGTRHGGGQAPRPTVTSQVRIVALALPAIVYLLPLSLQMATLDPLPRIASP